MQAPPLIPKRLWFLPPQLSSAPRDLAQFLETHLCSLNRNLIFEMFQLPSFLFLISLFSTFPIAHFVKCWQPILCTARPAGQLSTDVIRVIAPIFTINVRPVEETVGRNCDCASSAVTFACNTSSNATFRVMAIRCVLF